MFSKDKKRIKMQEFEPDFISSGSTEAIVQVREVPISVRINGVSSKRMFLINADKIHGKGLVVSFISPVSESTRITVSSSNFE